MIIWTQEKFFLPSYFCFVLILFYVFCFSFFCHFAHVDGFLLSPSPVPIRNLPHPGRSCFKVALIDHTSSLTPATFTTLLRFFTAYSFPYINAVLKFVFFFLGGGGDSWPLKMGPIGCPETSEWNYHYSLRNSPERISHLLRGGSLKSRRLVFRGDAPVLLRKSNQRFCWRCVR